MTQQCLIIFRRKAGVKARTSRLAWRSLSFSARTRCCSALSARRFSCETSQDPGKQRRRFGEPLLLYLAAIHSQSCPSGRWAPPPPSSCTRSEHRLGPAARSDPCSDVSSGCPVGGGTAALSSMSSWCTGPCVEKSACAYIKVHLFTIRDLWSGGSAGGSHVTFWSLYTHIFKKRPRAPESS